MVHCVSICSHLPEIHNYLLIITLSITLSAVHFYSIVFVLEGYFIIWAVWHSLIKKQNKTKNNPSPWRGKKKIKLLQFNESICTSKRNFYVTSVIRLASLVDKTLRDSWKPLPGSARPKPAGSTRQCGTLVKKGQPTAPRWREGRDSGRGWWQSAVEASASSHLGLTLRKASAFAILKSRGETKTRRKLKGLEEERVSWSPGEEAERLMRRPESPARLRIFTSWRPVKNWTTNIFLKKD